jgi:S-adenosylmethionine hydrolase
MTIVLFTDFGARDLYVGQLEAVLHARAPDVRILHLLHEAPAFNVAASAHLLAALTPFMPHGGVCIGVVDPGVGTERDGAVVRADDRWFVGPDNGLFSVLAARTGGTSTWRIIAQPPGPAVSFHGRDLFALIAAAIARGDFPDASAAATTGLGVNLGAEDLAEVIYIDHYGNAFTGIRAQGVSEARRLVVNGREIRHARVFGEVRVGDPFWYANSIGLVEIAVNRGNAARILGLAVGQPVSFASV